MGGWDQNGFYKDWLGGCRVDPVGTGEGLVAGSCKYGDEPLGSGTMELESNFQPCLNQRMILLKNVTAMPLDHQCSACHKMLLSVGLSWLEVDRYKNYCMMNYSDCLVQMEPQSV
jgi:hypothetical protein